MSTEADLLRALGERSVRFVAIGVWGVNQYANDVRELFVTEDKDLFLPLDAENLLRAWQAAETAGLEIRAGNEPLDQPRDLVLARAVVERRALTRALDGKGLLVDYTLVMARFDFDVVWKQRRVFLLDGVEVPVARLDHILTSKAAAGRTKDKLFFATYEQVLGEMKRRGKRRGSGEREGPKS